MRTPCTTKEARSISTWATEVKQLKMSSCSLSETRYSIRSTVWARRSSADPTTAASRNSNSTHITAALRTEEVTSSTTLTNSEAAATITNNTTTIDNTVAVEEVVPTITTEATTTITKDDMVTNTSSTIKEGGELTPEKPDVIHMLNAWRQADVDEDALSMSPCFSPIQEE